MGNEAHVHATDRVMIEIRAERVRQKTFEGFDIAHDDAHDRGELARAPAAYAVNASYNDKVLKQRSQWNSPPAPWPQKWDRSWFKPKDRRRDLVRAAALLVAEIERIDRGGKTR